MRTVKDIQFDIDVVQRKMALILIQQSDLDNQLKSLDRRRAYLEKERNSVSGRDSNEIS